MISCREKYRTAPGWDDDGGRGGDDNSESDDNFADVDDNDGHFDQHIEAVAWFCRGFPMTKPWFDQYQPLSSIMT